MPTSWSPLYRHGQYGFQFCTETKPYVCLSCKGTGLLGVWLSRTRLGNVYGEGYSMCPVCHGYGLSAACTVKFVYWDKEKPKKKPLFDSFTTWGADPLDPPMYPN